MDAGQTVIIGAGPGGLAAAHELARQGLRPLVLEKLDKVGGLARTEMHKGYRFDIGGHRFYTRSAEVQRLWEEMLGEDFVRVRRLSRIHYKGRFYKYPLSLFNTLGNLGVVESSLILLSYLRAKLRPSRAEDTFEQWVTNRFGARLYRTFFETYTEKVWGMPCSQIRADWAAQRIAGLSVSSAVRSALFGNNGARTLIREFHYPVLGPGMMWKRFAEAVAERGGSVRLGGEVLRLRHEGGRVRSVVVGEGRTRGRDAPPTSEAEVPADRVISSMPLSELVSRLSPAPPAEVLRAAAGLRYRAFILVALILDRPSPFPDNWLYIHTPTARVGRIQNFQNWSPAMVPDPATASLGMEYFCTEGDDLWTLPDERLIDLAARELEELGIARRREAIDGAVVRQPMAYPVYDHAYRANLLAIRSYLATFENLQTIGRNGMHQYNNQDHSMLTGILAARNILGEEHDLWRVGHDPTCYEASPAWQANHEPQAASSKLQAPSRKS